MRDHIFSRAISLRPTSLVSKTFSYPYTVYICGVTVLLLPNPLPKSPEAIGHDSRDRDEVVCRSEAADGEVPAVLDGIVAAGGRHVLRELGRHGGGVGGVYAEREWRG